MPDLTANEPLSDRMDSPHRVDHAADLADVIVGRLRPKTVLDAGCGAGLLVQALRDRGVDAYGFDPSDTAIAGAAEPVRAYLWVGGPGDPIHDRYDLITCTVAPDDLTAIAGATDRILVTESSPDVAARLADAAFFLDPGDATLTARSSLYVRDPAVNLGRLVRAYETLLAETRRDRRELERLRSREERATDAMTQSLRLRDLLIVSERTLGQVRGEVARLRDQLHGYDDLAARHEAVMSSMTWRIGWKMMGPYRKLRQRTGR
jgi:SAM-dependent methyltransferase